MLARQHRRKLLHSNRRRHPLGTRRLTFQEQVDQLKRLHGRIASTDRVTHAQSLNRNVIGRQRVATNALQSLELDGTAPVKGTIHQLGANNTGRDIEIKLEIIGFANMSKRFGERIAALFRAEPLCNNRVCAPGNLAPPRQPHSRNAMDTYRKSI